MTVTIESAPDPGVGHIAGKGNEPVPLGDEVARGLERTVEVVKAHLVVALLAIQSNDVVAESHKEHVDGFDPAQQVRINGARQDNSVNQTMFLQYGRQVNLLRRSPRRIMQHGKQNMMLQAAGIRLHAL